MKLPTNLGPSYALIEEIGEGGLAKVYLGLDYDRPCAVKCLKPEHLGNVNAMASFVREIKIASRLSHPNIPKITDSGKVNDLHFAVMELMVGMRLIEMMHLGQSAEPTAESHAAISTTSSPTPNRPVFSVPLILHILHECCSTLTYLHTTSVFDYSNSVLFHGDLSPENLLVTREGSVLLLDFGSAGQNSSFDPSHRHLGKLHYLPPEVLAGKPFTTETDVYSMAVLAYYLLFGRRPYEADSKLALLEAIRSAPVPRPECEHLVVNKNDAQLLRLFFNQALNKDPKLRFKSASEFHDHLFRIHFRESRPADGLKAAKLFPEAVREKMERLETAWSSSVQNYKKERYRITPNNTPVQSLLTQSDRRRHPRVPTDPANVFAEIISTSDKAKLQFAVHELSRGGMLLRWQGLTPRLGENYPLALYLNKQSIPIKGTGKLLYELSRSARSFVGFECTWVGDNDLQKIARYITEKLPTRENEISKVTAVQNQLDVFFRDLGDFKVEFEKNIRFGGMFVVAESAFATDVPIIVRVQLPGRLGKVMLKGRVVYCTPQSQNQKTMHGVGVQLEASEAQLRALFHEQLG